jgi:hypothetical protein
MCPFERISHASGRNSKRLHYERAKDESQYKRGYQPFEGVCDFSRPVLAFSSLRGGTAFIALISGHIRQSCLKLNSASFILGQKTKREIMPVNFLLVNKLFRPVGIFV